MKTAEGVYFRREDYSSFWRRLVVDLIDISVVFAVCLIITVSLSVMFPTIENRVILLTWIAVWFAYFVPLKRSRFRTVGYRVGRVRIVGMDGRIASWYSLTLRLLFAVLGPLNWLVDLGWLSGDPHRQSLRDKFAQTYVVKMHANPAGRAQLGYQYVEICGVSFLLREVKIDQTVVVPCEPTPGMSDRHLAKNTDILSSSSDVRVD
jgi:uncharacterized RDD family membrane protein YckC